LSTGADSKTSTCSSNWASSPHRRCRPSPGLSAVSPEHAILGIVVFDGPGLQTGLAEARWSCSCCRAELDSADCPRCPPSLPSRQARGIFRMYARSSVAWKEKAMGEIIWQQGASGLAVSTSIGPSRPADVTVMRVQVATEDGQFLQLNLTEWADLCSAVRQ